MQRARGVKARQRGPRWAGRREVNAVRIVFETPCVSTRTKRS